MATDTTGSSTATARPRAECTLLALAGLLALSPAARSADWSFGADVGVAETDNVALTATDKLSQTTAIADLDFGLRQQSARLDAILKGDFGFLRYLQHAYGSELVGRFDGLAHVALISDQLIWTVQDDFGQGQVNPFGAPTPTNRENIDVLNTGPDWTLHFGSTEFATLGARYVRAQYETSPFDSSTGLVNAAWGADLSSHSRFLLEANTERVSFDNTLLNTDFDRSSADAHYQLHGARTDIVTTLGATLLSRAGESTVGPLLRLDLSRTISSDEKLTMSAGRQLTDASSSFSASQAGAIGAITTAPAPQTSAPYTSTYASLGWRWQRVRTSFGLSGNWEQDTYRQQPLANVNRMGGEFALEHKLTRALSVRFSGAFYYADYPHNVFTSYDVFGGAGLVLRAGRDLEFQLRYANATRFSNLSTAGYTQNVAYLTVGYRPQLRRDRPTTVTPSPFR
jgi:hypothetical protein